MVNNECAPHNALRPSPVGIANRAQPTKTTIVARIQETGTNGWARRADPPGGREMAISNGLIHVRTLQEGIVPANIVEENTGGQKYVSIICTPN